MIVKEGRPFTGYWSVGDGFIDAPKLLARECEILQLLHETRAVPEAIDLFTEWEHTFLVQEFVTGVTYYQYWAAATHILGPFIHRPGRVQTFAPRFARLGLSLIGALRRIHEHGVVLGDVSPTNIFVEDLDSLAVRFIDLESAMRPDIDVELQQFSSQWATPGFWRDDRLRSGRVTARDDLFAAAMLLYGAVAPIQSFMTLQPDARWRILENFVRIGLPERVLLAIQTLSEGEVTAAEDHLQRLLES